MPKRKMSNNKVQNTTQKTKDQATQTPLKTGAPQVSQKGKQFLFHMWHLMCYSSKANELPSINNNSNFAYWIP
jgi:hypothetical protein